MKIKIIIATHIEYEMPSESIYLPVEVGAKGKNRKLGFQKDDEGENISHLNSKFSELTALYWAWKNLDSDVIGLVHYRRHLGLKKARGSSIKERLRNVLNKDEVEDLIKEYDLILPKKRNYYIDTLYSHYRNTLYVEPLDKAIEITSKMYPTYKNELRILKKKRSGYMFNMMIGRKSVINDYLEWLFPILFELEKHVGKNQYTDFHARYPGRVSELLFNVWLEKQGLKVKEVELVDTEPVMWGKKIGSFLRAKISGEKYGDSF